MQLEWEIKSVTGAALTAEVLLGDASASLTEDVSPDGESCIDFTGFKSN